MLYFQLLRQLGITGMIHRPHPLIVFVLGFLANVPEM